MFDKLFSKKFKKFETKIRRIITLHGTAYVKYLMFLSYIVENKIKKLFLKQRVPDFR